VLEKAQLVIGDQDWSAWSFEVREYGTGTRAPRAIRFRLEAGGFACV